jgi:outer membrane protein OmpA-like peptidoglycan-associated protein
MHNLSLVLRVATASLLWLISISLALPLYAKSGTEDSVYKLFEQLQNDFVHSSPLLDPIPKQNHRFVYVGGEFIINIDDIAYGVYVGADLYDYWSFDLHYTNFHTKEFDNIYHEVSWAIDSIFYPNWEMRWSKVIVDLYFKLGLTFNTRRFYDRQTESNSTETVYTLNITNNLGVNYSIGGLWYLPTINNWRLRTEYARNSVSYQKTAFYLGIEYLTGYSKQGYMSIPGFDRRYQFIDDNSFVLFFPAGTYKITSEHVATLQKIMTYLHNDHNLRLFISGHSSGSATEGYVSFEKEIKESTDQALKNRLQEIELSQRRSQTITDYFTKKQINSDRIITTWYGSSALSGSELAEEFEHNRRVVVTLTRSLRP